MEEDNAKQISAVKSCIVLWKERKELDVQCAIQNSLEHWKKCLESEDWSMKDNFGRDKQILL